MSLFHKTHGAMIHALALAGLFALFVAVPVAGTWLLVSLVYGVEVTK
ncbi:MAG: hypothetical protein INH13_25790 [Cupriavidus sp.]|nr:hypothetical protein [Cupriavidus sp.]